MNERTFSVATITVAWNGSTILPRQLRALLEQTRSIQEIIVVDNASTDDTLTIVRRDFPNVTALSMPDNLGVGGGFVAGLEYAFKKGHDWFWLFDQDSQPAPKALEELLKALEQLPEQASKIGILASLPVDPQFGVEHYGLYWRDRFVPVPPEESRRPICFVDLVISSGSLIRREAIQAVGFPRKDFFMDFVDHEFNLRIRRGGFQIAQVRQSILYHQLGRTALKKRFLRRSIRMVSSQPSWRRYYMTRNETFTAWHLFGTPKSRAFLVLRMLRCAVSIVFFEDEERIASLRMHALGFWHGLNKKLGIRRTTS